MDMPNEMPPSSGGGSSPHRSLRYRGRTITMMDPGEVVHEEMAATPTLTIDATEVMVRREEIGGFSAPMLNMFAVYDSLEELAKSLIDLSPVFLAQPPATKPSE